MLEPKSEANVTSTYVSTTSMNQSATLTYSNIRLNTSTDPGQFRTMNEKFGWRARKSLNSTNKTPRTTIQLDSSNVKSVYWSCTRANEYQLLVIMKNEDIYRFNGFKEMDHSALETHIRKHWKFNLEEKTISTEGWNWGVVNVSEKNLEFLVKEKTAFNLLPKQVNQVSITKNDVSVILNPDSQKAEAEDQLLEIRFYMPALKSDEDEKAEEFKQSIIKFPKAKTGIFLQAICILLDLKLLVPSGRFNLESLKLVGKSNDFVVDFKNVTQIFLLSSFSSPHVNIVLSLSTPIRKGHTSYHNIIIQFEAKKSVRLELMLDLKEASIKEALSDFVNAAQNNDSEKESDAEKLEKKKELSDKIELKSEQTSTAKNDIRCVIYGEEHLVAARLLQQLINKPLTQSGAFKSNSNQSCFRVSYKADSGTFYPLDSSFIFLPKPLFNNKKYCAWKNFRISDKII